MIAEINIQAEYERAVAGAGCAQLDTAVLRVEGPDRVKWLHKLITADVENLMEGQGVHSALLDAKGHFVADLIALAETEAVLLLSDPAAKDVLLSALRRYIIREKVKLVDETNAWSLVTVIGSNSDETVANFFQARAPDELFAFTRVNYLDARLMRAQRATVPATDVLIPSTTLDNIFNALGTIPQLSAETLDVLRIEAGLPRWGIDFDATTLALEIPGVMSIRVDQGCYVGQEVVARIVHRGHVNRQLGGLQFDGNEIPARGAPIFHAGNPVGSVTSAAFSPRLGAIGMGYVRREVSELGTQVQVGDASHQLSARIVELPFRH